MSARESGSDTWPRFAAFSGDNLDPGDAPEEDHVDHRAEPPSWLSGTAAVGTGADPPDQETGNGDQHNSAEHSSADYSSADYSNAEYRGGQAYPENGTYLENGNGETPGFTGSGFSPPSHDGQGYAPGFGDVAADPPDFGGVPGGSQDFGNAPGAAPGFGDGAGTPDFGGAPDITPDFGSAPAAGSGFGDISTGAQDFSGIHGGSPAFGADRLSDPFDSPAAPFDSPAAAGFDNAGGAGFASQAEPAQAFSDDQPRSDYGGDYRAGEYRSGFGASQAGTPLPSSPLPSSPQAGSPFGSGGPAVGTMYGGQQAYQPGQENGAGTQTQSPPFTSQYPPVEPPGRSGKMTASLRAVRRPKSAASAKKRAQAGRQAQLTVTRVEPWSVMKFSFVISLVAFIVLFVAVALLYAVLSGLGVFSSLQHTVQNITSSQSASGFNLGSYLSASRVLGYTGLLGALNVVLITALATVGSVLYNITAGLAGGVEITLKESD